MDDTCWIIKSHDPVTPGVFPFKANKVIICMRNPLDVIVSFVHFMNCLSHSKQLDIDFPLEEPVFWDSFIYNMVEMHKGFYS